MCTVVLLTCDVERHLEAVLAAAVASDARVETTVVLSCRVNNERVKSILVHHDFVVGVVMNLCDVHVQQAGESK